MLWLLEFHMLQGTWVIVMAVIFHMLQGTWVIVMAVIFHMLQGTWVINPRPLRPKGYCRHLRLSVCPSVCLSVPIILVNTITQSVYPISPPNLLGGFNMALPWMVL